ncbi:hypothetical protein RYX36_024291 [Vicia faba]
MDPDPFTASLFKWDPCTILPTTLSPLPQLLDYAVPPTTTLMAYHLTRLPRELGGLEELFQAYIIRYYMAVKIAELGFTVSTLVDMKDDELDDMMVTLVSRWDLLVGERYGIKAAIRDERRRLDKEEIKHHGLLSSDTPNTLDALSQEGLLEDPVVQREEAADKEAEDDDEGE